MPLYNVEVSMTIVVFAEDDLSASDVAIGNARQAMSDSEPDAFVLGEVKKIEDLFSGWDGACIAYGGDGNKRISAYLGEK